jgi:hypothetical protein
MYTILLEMSILELTYCGDFMENKEKILQFQILVSEKKSYVEITKAFSMNSSSIASVIVDVIEYLKKNYYEDYLEAVKRLREKRRNGSD